MTKELGRDDKHLQNFIEQQHPYSDLTGRIELFFSNDVSKKLIIVGLSLTLMSENFAQISEAWPCLLTCSNTNTLNRIHKFNLINSKFVSFSKCRLHRI